MNDLLETIKELRKERRKWYNKIYNLENKEKLKEKKKIYYLNNKENYKEYSKEYRLENIEKLREYNKKYRLENKEEISEQKKEYSKTPSCYKSYKIKDWKRYGVIHNDFEKLFELYVNTTNCENCNVILTRDRQNTSTTKCLDHCHISGKFRNILCHACNVRRGI